MNKRIGSAQIESEVLRSLAQHLAKPLAVIVKKTANQIKSNDSNIVNNITDKLDYIKLH